MRHGRVRLAVGVAAPSMTALLALAGVALMGGCRSSPIEIDGQRSQFDRHDLLQGDWSTAYTEDEFGKRVPNLRARLLQR